MRRLATVVLAFTCLLPEVALAADQPISGASLQLRSTPSGKQKVVFKSKDPAFLFPTAGGSDDPLTAGAVLELLSPAASTASMTAPASGVLPGWSTRSALFKFKRGKGSATITALKAVVLRQGRKITVTADMTGLAMTAPLGRVGVRLVTGTLRNCAVFADAAVLQDVPGKFIGKDAPSPSDCSYPTLTGLSPTCGDGEVDQSSELCDGNDLGECPPLAECRLPGVAGECQCCSNGGAFATSVGCCNPSSILIPAPNFGLCFATGCPGPYQCDEGAQCQAGGSCCAVEGGEACALGPPFSRDLVPCCPGLVCSHPVINGALQGFTCCAPGPECCAAAGESCTLDHQCCSQHCQVDGTCSP